LTHPIEQYTLVDTALAQVMAKIRINRKAELVPPWLAYGRVSATDVVALSNVPRFPTSHWDGYAVISEDLDSASDSNPVTLNVVGSAEPGRRPKRGISHGEAVQVVTGAPLPSGADSVVPVESVQRSAGLIIVREPSSPGSHIYGAGEDTRKGDVLIRKGQTIRAQDVGLLISVGFKRTRVWHRPKVSVIATGSELMDIRRPKVGRVANSHSHVFLRLLEETGCVPIDAGIVGDEMSEISRGIRRALAVSDFILTLGGTSAGKHDHVAAAVAELGPDVIFHGIKMDRGRVTGISMVKGRPILMMPGPIQGAMNAFLLLGLPIIEVLSGTGARGTEIPSAFTRSWEARTRYADFRKVVYVKIEGGPQTGATPLEGETESMKILANADGYVIVPENIIRIEAGERAMVKLLPGFSFAQRTRSWK